MAGAGVASSEVVGAVALGAAALRLAEIGVAAAGSITGVALTASEEITMQSIHATDRLLGEYGVRAPQ